MATQAWASCSSKGLPCLPSQTLLCHLVIRYGPFSSWMQSDLFPQTVMSAGGVVAFTTKDLDQALNAYGLETVLID